MKFILYNLDEEEIRKIEELERENPDIVVRTVSAGFDGSFYTELLIEAVPALIEAAGAIIAAFIVARATKKSADNKDKGDAPKAHKSKKIIIKCDDGNEYEIANTEKLYKVLKEYYGQ